MEALPSPKRILIVDDDAEIADFMRQALARFGLYHIDLARDGVEAVDHSRRHRIDLILMDVCLPGFSGYWFCKAFKERPQTRNIPVLFVSGLSGEEDVRRAMELGACGYLKKPFRTDDLVAAVSRALAA